MTFQVEKFQILPYQKLGVLRMDTYEKALRVAWAWIESVKDSYDDIRHAIKGPDYFFTITEI